MSLQVDLLEQSFKLVAPQGDKVVARFYERLFQKSPSAKPLFKSVSMADQKKKLLASLVLAITMQLADTLLRSWRSLRGAPGRRRSGGPGLRP